MPPQFVTTREVATAFRVTDRAVRLWCASGILPASNLTGRWRIRRDDYVEFLERVQRGVKVSPRSKIGAESGITPRRSSTSYSTKD